MCYTHYLSIFEWPVDSAEVYESNEAETSIPPRRSVCRYL